MNESNLLSANKKPIYKKIWFWVLLIIVLGIIGKLGEAGKNNTTQATVKEPERVTSESEQNAKIGEVITFDDSRWVVISAKVLGSTIKSNNMFQKPAHTTGKFVMVEFKITNTKEKEDRILDHPKLIDDKGREFKCYDQQNFYIPKDAEPLTLSSLPAGLEKTFWAVYEVPADAKGLMFKSRALSSFGKEQLVWLVIE